ncbi:hypothetical protein MMSR116_29315 [Methylobacterium mesophilicum SR1.6/6]|uniref:Uncharacterized protein n=1 Tax=Methylobacterium mesophilicum SR1.6/6 TaxID=908290 RepID=A0A6B9FUW6_9HYPH|nr:hypothetical protein [Methylobacterium mesophilicum]QGY05536.1 hypothetical protein MMSR116_29315 [Methylobacterium mesophilicum SR1.6/6]
MTDPKPFRPDKAAHVKFGDLHTDFILPICLPDPELMVGDALAVLVVTTVEGQRVGVPIGVNALEHLRGIVEAGLRMVQIGNKTSE